MQSKVFRANLTSHGLRANGRASAGRPAARGERGTTSHQWPARATHSERTRSAPRRALIWDSNNTASVIAAHTMAAHGWRVDAILPPSSPWRGELAFNGERTIASVDDPCLEEIICEHPADALFLFGDDQVRWFLARYSRLPAHLRAQLPPPASAELALSKERSAQLAAELGVPTLPTRFGETKVQVERIARELGDGHEVVLKGDGGSAGSAVRTHRSSTAIVDPVWQAITAHSPRVGVQKRLRGPRLFVTVVYEHGCERAACAHRKLAVWPKHFGITAVGITEKHEAVHDYTERIFRALNWHGVANVEFRQDIDDGQWYFMEINPRVNASLGLQSRAGLNVPAIWAAISRGEGNQIGPSRAYSEGVGWWWAVPTFALMLHRPWQVAQHVHWKTMGTDWDFLNPASRAGVLKLATWHAVRANQ